jgi:hypothetical protein
MSGSQVQPIKFLNCSVVSFNCSIGFNSSPSTLSATLAEDFDAGDDFGADDHDINDELGSTQGGQPFLNGNPGSFATFSIPGSDFKFAGIVTSYRRSKSIAGNLINIELSDPRILLNQIPLINDTNLDINNTGFNTISWNIFCAPSVFNNPIDLDWSVEGVRFDKLAVALQTKLFSFYNTNYKIAFDSSFYSNLAGGYRLKQQSSTVEDAINQAARDCGMDWFVDIDPGPGWNIIKIKGIKRRNQYNFEDSNGLRSFIEDRANRVSSWEIGRELREEPTVSVVVGDRVRTLWNTSPNGNFPRLCELGNGMVIDRPLVILDYIFDQYVGNIAANIPTLNVKVSSTNTVTSITNSTDEFGNNRVPYPRRDKAQSSVVRRGYIATENVLRAALHSKASWATTVWYEYRNPANGSLYQVPYNTYNSFDIGYGFGAPSSNSTSLFSMDPANIGVTGPDFDFEQGQPSLTSVVTSNTNPLRESLKDAVYEATRQMAEDYYGKKFICRLPSSTICDDIGTSYFHNEKKIPIEYEITDAAPDIAFYNTSASIGLPNSLIYSDSSSFKNQNGLLKAFAFINPFSIFNQFSSYQIAQIDKSELIRAANSVADINTSSFNSETLFYSGVSVEPYRFDPRFALVTLNSHINCGLSTYRHVTPLTRFPNGKIKTFSVSYRQAYTSTTDKSGEFLELMSKIFNNLTLLTYDNANLKDPVNSKQLNLSFVNDCISVDYYFSLQTSAISLQEHVGLSEFRLINLDPSEGVSHGGFFIPLQWNYIKYGPWVNGNAYSRPVNLIEDSKLNPWNYGNYDRMNEAGSIIAERANTSTHTIAYANITVEGYPEFNLGGQIITSENDEMCNISDISMSFDTEGIKTTYKFKSFFGPTGFTKRSEISAVSTSSTNSFSNRQENIKVSRIYDDILAKIYEKTGSSNFGNRASRGIFTADSLVSSSSPVNANPSISNVNSLDAKRASESSSNYPNLAMAHFSSIFTPYSTYPTKAKNGQAPTIEGGIIS